jgi:glycosyltransferase involved in cell wall biosynthesis
LQSRPWSSYEGFTDREKLKAFFQKASVLALPSLEDNCPMVVLEAMAAGLPVMASRVGGVPDLIQSDKTGLLCDPAEPASFAAAAQRLIEGLSFRRLLAGRAKQHALQTFHPSVVARRHVEIYRDILNGVC